MGLFGSKSKTYYNSQHIPLKELDKYHKNYINSLVMASAFRTDRYTSATDVISEGLLNSPGRGLIRLLNLQEKIYGSQGNFLLPLQDYSNFEFKPLIDLHGGDYYTVDDVLVSYLEPSLYASEWIYNNRPDLSNNTDFSATYYPKTDKEEAFVLYDNGSERFSIPMKGIDPNTKTLYMTYTSYLNNGKSEQENIIYSTKVDSFESLDSNWKSKNIEAKEIQNTLDTTTKIEYELNGEITFGSETTTSMEIASANVEEVFVNNRVSEEDKKNNIVYKQIKRVTSTSVELVESVKRFNDMYIDENNNVAYRTRIVTTTKSVIKESYIETCSNIVNVNNANKGTYLYIYRQFTGNKDLDIKLNTQTGLGTKVLPLKIKGYGSLYGDNYQKQIYENNTKLFNRFTNRTSKYGNFITDLKDNEIGSVQDIMLMFGVEIDSGKYFNDIYCYRFFDSILDTYNIPFGIIPNDMPIYSPNAVKSVNANGICKQRGDGHEYNPGIGKVFRLRGNGRYKNTSKIGKMECYRGDQLNTPRVNWGSSKPNIGYVTQIDINNWEGVFVHYGWENVLGIQHWDAHGITADGGNPHSGRRIPIIESALKTVGLRYLTDISMYSPSLVFTSHQTVKKKWYQRGIFKVVVLIVMIVITIIFPPSGSLAASVAGTAGMAIATAIGVTGLTAMVMASALNTLISMVLAEMIGRLATKAIGGQLGQLIGSLVTAFATMSLNNFASTGSFDIAQGFSSMMKADNWLNLSNASNALSAIVNKQQQSKINSLEDRMKKIEDLKSQLESVEEKLKEFNSKNGVFSTEELLELTSTHQTGFISVESPDTFLSRTLMKGSDIVDSTFSVIYDYAEINLNLKTDI